MGQGRVGEHPGQAGCGCNPFWAAAINAKALTHLRTGLNQICLQLVPAGNRRTLGRKQLPNLCRSSQCEVRVAAFTNSKRTGNSTEAYI